MSQKCLAHELLKILENMGLFQPSPSRLIPNTYSNVFHNIGLQVQINTYCVLIYVNTHQIHINTYHNTYQYIYAERKPVCWTKIWCTDLPLDTKYRHITCQYMPWIHTRYISILDWSALVFALHECIGIVVCVDMDCASIMKWYESIPANLSILTIHSTTYNTYTPFFPFYIPILVNTYKYMQYILYIMMHTNTV